MFSSPQRIALLATLSIFTTTTFANSSINRLDAIRLGDRINVMVALFGKDGGAMQVWQAYDCKNLQAEALYRNILNAEGRTKARFYGEQYEHYLPPQMAANQDAETIKRICSIPEKALKWEKIQATDETGATTLIDLASLKRNGDTLQVRVGTDYATTDFDPPYSAPFALKIESYRYQCSTHALEATSGINIDEMGYVTDSLDSGDIAARQSAFSMTPLLQKTFTQLCDSANLQQFHALGLFKSATNKPLSKAAEPILPELGNNPASVFAALPLDATLQHQASTLLKPWATPRFKQISWVEKGRTGKVRVRIDVDEAGFLRKLEDYGMWKVQRLMLANLIQLKFAMSIATSPSRLESLQTTLRFPLTVGQKFTVDTNFQDSNHEKKNNRTFEQCEVYAGGDAKNLNPALRGNYLRVACNEQSNQKPLRTQSAWLEDLNVLVPLSSVIGDAAEDKITLEDVQISR